MFESEYIKATNRVKVSMALMILRDVLPSAADEWGISCDDLGKITVLLSRAEEKLFSLVDIKEDAD